MSSFGGYVTPDYHSGGVCVRNAATSFHYISLKVIPDSSAFLSVTETASCIETYTYVGCYTEMADDPFYTKYASVNMTTQVLSLIHI